MEQQFQTSFIPKKPVTESRTPISHGSVNFVSIIAIVIFVVAGVLFGGAYFYNLTLTKERDTLTADIVKKQQLFDPAFMKEITTLDKRIKAAKDVLNKHTMVSPIFTRLEQLSLKTIQFTKFELTPLSTTSTGQVSIKMSGKAVNYAAIALESDVLAGVGTGKNTYFINPIFSNLNLDDRARVSFDLTFSVDAELTSYAEYIKKLSSVPSFVQ